MSIKKIGVDFDKTLAYYEHNPEYHPEQVGEPIPEMVERVRGWMDQGIEVVIFTARVHPENQINADISRCAIQEWCMRVFGRVLEITCMKDPEMDQIWDDRAITVEENTGRILTVTQEEVEKDGADSLGAFLEGYNGK